MRGLGPILHMPTSPCTRSKLILSAKKVDYKAHMVLTPILAAPTPSYTPPLKNPSTVMIAVCFARLQINISYTARRFFICQIGENQGFWVK